MSHGLGGDEGNVVVTISRVVGGGVGMRTISRVVGGGVGVGGARLSVGRLGSGVRGAIGEVVGVAEGSSNLVGAGVAPRGRSSGAPENGAWRAPRGAAVAVRGRRHAVVSRRYPDWTMVSRHPG